MTDVDPELAALERAAAANPADLVVRHNLGVALRRRDRSEEALVAIELALRLGLRAPETAIMRAHLLGDLGRFDAAVVQYRAALRDAPGQIDAHETLARLLPQLGRADEALDSYRTALTQAPNIGMLWVSALATSYAIGQHEQTLAWAAAATARFGRDSIIDVAAANAMIALGDTRQAEALLREILAVEPDNCGALLTHAYALVRLNDTAMAERQAFAVTQLQPRQQSAWALLSILWRLHGDPREQWLADYERFIGVLDLREAIDDTLRETLTGMHLTLMQPAEQSLRGGTQTRGVLFERRAPAIRKLAAAIRTRVERWQKELPCDPAHPFLGRNSGGIAFEGSWSVRLRGEGFHVSHIHEAGWLSSAAYVAVPDEVGSSARAGALAFGLPDAKLGLDLSARRIVPARTGNLVVFPSYFWHGTLPFESADPRLTVAFDALPAD